MCKQSTRLSVRIDIAVSDHLYYEFQHHALELILLSVFVYTVYS